jgi:hypothetical protein
MRVQKLPREQRQSSICCSGRSGDQFDVWRESTPQLRANGVDAFRMLPVPYDDHDATSRKRQTWGKPLGWRPSCFASVPTVALEEETKLTSGKNHKSQEQTVSHDVGSGSFSEWLPSWFRLAMLIPWLDSYSLVESVSGFRVTSRNAGSHGSAVCWSCTTGTIFGHP